MRFFIASLVLAIGYPASAQQRGGGIDALDGATLRDALTGARVSVTESETTPRLGGTITDVVIEGPCLLQLNWTATLYPPLSIDLARIQHLDGSDGTLAIAGLGASEPWRFFDVGTEVLPTTLQILQTAAQECGSEPTPFPLLEVVYE